MASVSRQPAKTDSDIRWRDRPLKAGSAMLVTVPKLEPESGKQEASKWVSGGCLFVKKVFP